MIAMKQLVIGRERERGGHSSIVQRKSMQVPTVNQEPNEDHIVALTQFGCVAAGIPTHYDGKGYSSFTASVTSTMKAFEELW